MPQVTILERVYTPFGHHRRPRAGPNYTQLPGGSSSNVVTGTPVSATADPQILFGSPPVQADFLFWSYGDLTSGHTDSNPNITTTVGASPMTLIKWYFVPGGGPNGNGTVEIIDAYSVSRGDFVDDIFVNVTSDPSLDTEANDDGVVPTAVLETIDAFGGIHTGEHFDQWIRPQDDGTTAASELLTVPARTSSLAIATYDFGDGSNVTVPLGVRDRFAAFIEILFGVINDGPGLGLPGGNGPPVPIGPWGPLIARLLAVAQIQAAGRALPTGVQRQLNRIAAADAVEVGKQVVAVGEKIARE